jgi:hypothetical protein
VSSRSICLRTWLDILRNNHRLYILHNNHRLYILHNNHRLYILHNIHQLYYLSLKKLTKALWQLSTL